MHAHSPGQPTERSTSGAPLPVLLVLFVGTGCAALIYEIVWFTLLQLVIGSSAVSLGVLLGTFMGGMCLGSVGLPYVISARRHPLRVYALLELGVGTLAVVLLYGMPLVSRLYAEYVGHGLGGILLRGAVCAVCLLPATVLMGATLPAIARWIETTPEGVARLGLLYGANIGGAVFGCLLAGFYLLRVYDMATATYVAATLNAVVATVALALSARRSYTAPEIELARDETAAAVPRRWLVYVAIALSGLSAMGAEVVWTRQLSLLLGATVYTFSIILAVFLTGLGIGSSVGAYLSRTLRHPRIALGWCQLCLAGAIAWTAWMLGRSLPYWPINPSLSTSPWLSFQLDLVRCLWAMLPATCCWGASFPLALAAATARGRDPARLVSGIYAANTAGAIAGAVTFSLLVIAWLGTRSAQQLLIGLAVLAAVLMFGSFLRRPVARAELSGNVGRRRLWLWGGLGLAEAAAISAVLVWSVPETPPGLIAYGRYLPSWEGISKYLYVGEGMNASIAVSEAGAARNLHVSGKVVASSGWQDMRVQRMLGHFPALVHPKPRSVLVVGCGAGVTAGSFVLHPEVQRIVICEIEPLIPPVAEQYFGDENYDVMKDPRVEVVYDDARHYIATAGERFDIITSDPIHPWVKGAATLYSQEYFALCKRRLNPGGVIAQWVPLYETNLEAVKSQLATLFDAFPDGTIWSNDAGRGGYDVVVLGQDGPMKIDVDELQRRLDRKDHGKVVQSLEEVELDSAVGLLATYAGQGRDLRDWLRDAQRNRDGSLRLQYLAGMGLNLYRSASILRAIAAYCRYPENLFAASTDREVELREALIESDMLR